MKETRKIAAGKESLMWLPVKSLVMLRRNPQYLSRRQQEALAKSIKRDGFVVPILVRPLKKNQYEIVSGNHRYLAAKTAGMTRVPCVVLPMTENQAKRMAMNLNTIHGEPNAELLAPFLAEMDDDNLALIHLEDFQRDAIAKFSEELGGRLEALLPPDSLDRDSPKSEIGVCVCPLCQKKHIQTGVK
jgi:ParB/RepB/Spo0J family partition protein